MQLTVRSSRYCIITFSSISIYFPSTSNILQLISLKDFTTAQLLFLLFPWSKQILLKDAHLDTKIHNQGYLGSKAGLSASYSLIDSKK